MKFFQVIDTTSGAKFNALANDVAGAKRLQAIQAASGLAGRKGSVINGSRYEVEGETFDIAFLMEALQGAQPGRSERKAAAYRYTGPLEPSDAGDRSFARSLPGRGF